MLIKILQDNEKDFTEVPAEPVTIKGYEIFSLFVTQDPDAGMRYVVTEAATGRRLCAHQETAEKAVDACALFFKTITPQKLGERIAYFLLGPGGA